ncbi:MAG TPA: diguanylate cyclase [bacterium]|jgi:PAS domain-containing protein
MQNCPWAENLPVSITVCDREGKILDMNEKAVNTFAKDGGRMLIGQNALDCHPEPSRTVFQTMLAEHTSHIYTIEKNGVKKLIYQVPWQEEGEFAGIVEFAFEIPFSMPHFVRQP